MILIFTFKTESDRDKFEYIYTNYKRLMLHKAYSVLRDYSLAEDAASEAFIRVYKNLDKIDEPESKRAAAFVVTIVKNVALTMLQKRARQSADELTGDEPVSGFEDLVLDSIEQNEAFVLIDQLGEDAKALFLMKYAYDLSHKEIGKLLGLTENNVTVKLHRVKKKLAGMLVEKGYAYEG